MTPASRRDENKDAIVKLIDACVYGKLEKAVGPERLKIARSIDLYVQISPAGYSKEKIAAMFKQANIRRLDSRMPSHHYA